MNEGTAIKTTEAGFSLVELVAVSALLAIMFAVLFSTWTGIIRGQKIIENSRETYRAAQQILLRMTNELSGRVLQVVRNDEDDGEDNGDDENDGDTAGGPSPNFGSSLGQYIISVDKDNGESAKDSIRFTSTNAGQSHFGQAVNYGWVEVTYRLLENKNPPPQGREKAFYLVREERPADVENPDIREKRTIRFPLADNVKFLNFRYLTNGEWQDKWAGAGTRLPEAVEITVGLLGQTSETPDVFRTAVALSKRQRNN